jgi:hypothetical protein
MKDPTRLLESGSEFEASLLASAENDAPREGLDRRVRAAIGIGGIAIGATTASVTASAKGAPLLISLGIAKWAAIAVLGTGIAVGAAVAVRREASVSRTPYVPIREPSVKARGPVTRSSSTTPVPPSDVPTPIPRATESVPAQQAAPAAIRVNEVAPSHALSEGSPGPRPLGPATPALEDEVAILSRAHAALESGDTTLALGTLDRHDLDFMHGALAPEALEVRIEAYDQRHDEVKVAELGHAFLARYSEHPLAGKVRALLEKVSSP